MSVDRGIPEVSGRRSKRRDCEGFRMTAHHDDAAGARAVVRKPSSEGNRDWGERAAVPRALTYQELTVVAAIRPPSHTTFALWHEIGDW